MGNVTIFWETEDVPDLKRLKECYLDKHPDARRWLPDEDDAAHIVRRSAAYMEFTNM